MVLLDVSKMKVPELKKELKARGLNVSGNKNELVERLKGALQSTELSVSNDSVEDLDEDILNDDFDDQTTDTSVALDVDLERALEDTPNPKTTQKRAASENGTEKEKSPKKIKLSREFPKVEDAKPQETENEAESKHKVIKLSSLTAKERLEMRAKKFGVPLTVDARKAARAARFGSSSTETSSSNVTPELDVLKKRADRFGGSVSKAMSNLEQQEKLEKRKARFGINK